jgi:hypothetical protein
MHTLVKKLESLSTKQLWILTLLTFFLVQPILFLIYNILLVQPIFGRLLELHKETTYYYDPAFQAVFIPSVIVLLPGVYLAWKLIHKSVGDISKGFAWTCFVLQILYFLANLFGFILICIDPKSLPFHLY